MQTTSLADSIIWSEAHSFLNKLKLLSNCALYGRTWFQVLNRIVWTPTLSLSLFPSAHAQPFRISCTPPAESESRLSCPGLSSEGRKRERQQLNSIICILCIRLLDSISSGRWLTVCVSTPVASWNCWLQFGGGRDDREKERMNEFRALVPHSFPLIVSIISSHPMGQSEDNEVMF